MKKLVKILSVMLAVILVCSAPLPAQAATSTNTKAHKAFTKQIKKLKKRGTGYYYNNWGCYYTYADIDGDKVDELIAEPRVGICYQIVFDYQNGKVKEVARFQNGTFTQYYTKRKVLKSSWMHSMASETRYSKFTGGKYKIVAVKSFNLKTKKTSYYVNDKKVSKSKYNSYVKKLTKNDSGKKYSSLKNWKKY